MLIIPAIDLLGRKVVRLYKGKKSTSKVYSIDPPHVAQRWKEYGASWIHIVDLDASFGEGDNLSVIKEIIDVGVNVQVGGGIRSFKKVSKVIKLGAKRLIIGTKATEGKFLDTILKVFPNKIGVSVDVLEGKCMKAGWLKDSDYEFLDFIEYLVAKRVKWIIYTDINRDGTLGGINLQEIEKLKAIDTKGCHIIVSGGISSLQDLFRIKELGFIYGVILGRALYEGLIDLKEAIDSLK